MTSQQPPSAFTKEELFDYAYGDLDEERARQLESQIKVDAELAGKVAFFSSLLGKTLNVEETGGGLVDSSASRDKVS